MKENNLFDILANAEDDTMERLIDKCPEISDSQLDKILSMSERKYKKEKKEIERTEKADNIEMTENDTVEGVERVKRPAWFAPLSMAASFILIAGIALGSTMLLRKNGHNSGGGEQLPAVTVTTKKSDTTTDVTSAKSGSGVTTTFTTASGAKGSEKATTVIVTGTGTESSTSVNGGSAAEVIKPYVGKWRYQTSPNNTVHTDGVDTGIVEIFDDATYKYTDNNGNVSAGTVKYYSESLGGSEITGLEFSGDTFVGHVAYYVESMPYELHFGNGDAARIVRYDHVDEPRQNVSDWKTAYRNVLTEYMQTASYNDSARWDLADLDSDGTFELLISMGESRISGGVRIYYYENGIAEPVLNDYDGGVLMFGYYGEFKYCSDEGLIRADDIHLGYEVSAVYNYRDHSVTIQQSVSNDKGAVGPENATYTVNDQNVSEEVYNSTLNEINSKNWINAGRRYSFSDFSALN